MTVFRPTAAQALVPMLEALGKDGLAEGVLPAASLPLVDLAIVADHAERRKVSSERALVEVLATMIDTLESGPRRFLRARLALGDLQGRPERSRNTEAAKAITGSTNAKWQNVSRTEAPRVFGLLAGKLFDRDRELAAGIRGHRVLPQPVAVTEPPRLAIPEPTQTAEDVRLFIFGGISGTGVRHIANAWQSRSSDRVVIHFEDHLIEHARENYGHLALLTDGHSNRDLSLQDLIKLPEPVMAQLWVETLDRVIACINDTPPPRDIALVMHGTYYHLTSTASRCAISHPALARLADRAVQVVCFIDDLFDVHARLKRRRELYHSHNNALAALESLARWRTAETNALALAARTLASPFSVVATKHPVSVLEGITAHPGHGVYLSYPISGPRAHGLRAPEVIAYQEELAIFAAAVRSSVPIAVFEPTTIDEYRFDLDDGGRLRSRRLDIRWRLPRTADTIHRADAIADADPLTDEERASTEDVLQDLQLADTAQLESLRRELRRQVTERDHQLDRQADILIAYRPAWSPSGSVADGVRAELEYADMLVACGIDDRRSAFIIHPEADEHRRRVSALAHVLEEHQGLFTLPDDKIGARRAVLDEFVSDYANDADIKAIGEIDLAEALWDRLATAQAVVPKTHDDMQIGVMRNADDWLYIHQMERLADLGVRMRAALLAEFDAQVEPTRRCHLCHRPVGGSRAISVTQYPSADQPFWHDLTGTVEDTVRAARGRLEHPDDLVI